MNKLPKWIRLAVHRAKTRARKNDLPFDLTTEDIQDLWAKQNGCCYWFNIHLNPYAGPRHPLLPSLDRVDSHRGYTYGNVVLSCWAANRCKNDCDPDTWEEFLQFLAASLKSRAL
jgi:hypothetical protein